MRASPLYGEVMGRVDKVTQHGTGSRRPARTPPEQHQLADRVPSTNTALNESRTAPEGGPGDHGGVDPDTQHAVRPRLHDGEQLDGKAKALGRLDVPDVEPRDTLPVHVARYDLGPERHVGQDGGLGRGVEALDIGGGVPLGVAQALGLGQGVVVAGARGGHTRKDVVGGAVDDAHHPVDPFAGQRLSEVPV